MNTISIIESINNFFDFGVIIESLKNSLNRKFEMDMRDFFKHLIFGMGYYELTPPQMSEKIKNGKRNYLIVDLREKRQFDNKHIDGAISNPFDDFFKNVFIDKKYVDYIEKEIILVCDTGHMSRVAGSVLAEEGFNKIYSLKGGMRRWEKWFKLTSRFKAFQTTHKIALHKSCCFVNNQS